MRLEGPVLLYGAGREAKSTRRFLAEAAPGATVDVCVDSGPADIPDTNHVLVDSLTAAFRDRRYKLVVRSSGVSIYKPEIEAAKAAAIPVTTNVNLWAEYRRAGATVIAITGTKGKSTTAKLTFDMLVAAGIDAGLGGNIGLPPLDLEPHKSVVLELSSYQIADLDLAPDLVGITNLYPEHVDWHRTIQRYYDDKLRILSLSRDLRLALGPQAATHPAFTSRVTEPVRLLPALPVEFDDDVIDAVRASHLRGAHNLDNAVLAARLALAAGAGEDAIVGAIAEFTPLPHRLHELEVGDKVAVDDSIATTPEATKAAIAAYPLDRLALIAGGFDRGQDYRGLARSLDRSNVVLVACLPDTGPRLAEAIAELDLPIDVVEAHTLEYAMRQLKDRGDRFDVILLSPGAPSFGQFRDFEERGDRFLELAEKYFGR